MNGKAFDNPPKDQQQALLTSGLEGGIALPPLQQLGDPILELDPHQLAQLDLLVHVEEIDAQLAHDLATDGRLADAQEARQHQVFIREVEP